MSCIRLTSVFTTSRLLLNSFLAIALEGFKVPRVCLSFETRRVLHINLRTPCKLPFLRNAQYNVKLAWRLMRLHMFISSWANINEVSVGDSVLCRLDIYNIDPWSLSLFPNCQPHKICSTRFYNIFPKLLWMTFSGPCRSHN